MKATSRLLRWLGLAWLILATTGILLGYIGIVFSSGLAKLFEVLSPFSVWNYVSVIPMAPLQWRSPRS